MNVHQAEGLTRAVSPRRDRDHEPRRNDDRVRIVGLLSGKGGVGKSTLGVNVAACAASSGARTLLIDGDAGLTNADLLLGLMPRFDLGDWCEGRASLDEVVCAGPGGLGLLLAGSGREAHVRLHAALAGEDASGLGRLLEEQDLVVLDLGAGIGSALLELARTCEPIWLVATPEPTSLADAYATAKQIWQGRPSAQIELVVNRAPDREAGERTHQALSRLTRRFLSRSLPLRGVLPEDPAMLRAVARQDPVVLAEPATPVARRLVLLAESLLEEPTLRARGSDPSPGIGILAS